MTEHVSALNYILGCLALLAAFLAGVGLYELGVIFILHPIYRRLGWHK